MTSIIKIMNMDDLELLVEEAQGALDNARDDDHPTSALEALVDELERIEILVPLPCEVALELDDEAHRHLEACIENAEDDCGDVGFCISARRA